MSGEATPVSVILKPADKAAVDEWRRRQPDLPSRPQAVRELLREALSRSGAALSEPRHV
jgi:hypothetical protein